MGHVPNNLECPHIYKFCRPYGRCNGFNGVSYILKLFVKLMNVKFASSLVKKWILFFL